MALNWGDVALNFTAGAIDKSEQYRKEELEQRVKELQDNKELYRALATTRYSKDLDKYYKESEKFASLKSVYAEIEKGNLSKDAAINKIIQADPQYSKAWAFASSLGGDEGAAEQARIKAAVESNFKDKEDGSGYEFSHADLKFNLPQQEDYFQDANYWGELAREIESNTQGPLKKQIMKLLGKEPAEVDLNTLEQKAGTEIRTEMDDAKVYSSTNMDRIDSDIGSDISLTDFIDSIPSWKSKVYNSRSGVPGNNVKKEILNVYNAMNKGDVNFWTQKQGQDVEVTSQGSYVFGESKKIYSEINDIMWNNMLNSRDMNKYNDTDFNKQYEFEVKNRTITLNNKGYKSGWQGSIKGFYIVPTSVVPIGETVESFWDVDKQAFAEHMNQFTVNMDGKGKILKGAMGDPGIDVIMNGEALRWLTENAGENAAINKAGDTDDTDETDNTDNTDNKDNTDSVTVTEGGITQEKIDTNGIKIIKSLSTKSGDSAEDVIADFEENGFTVSEEIKTLAVINNAPEKRVENLGNLRKPEFVESEEWINWATTQLPKWENAISWLNTNRPEPPKTKGKGRYKITKEWQNWNKLYSPYYTEYERIQDLLKQTLSQ